MKHILETLVLVAIAAPVVVADYINLHVFGPPERSATGQAFLNSIHQEFLPAWAPGLADNWFWYMLAGFVFLALVARARGTQRSW